MGAFILSALYYPVFSYCIVLCSIMVDVLNIHTNKLEANLDLQLTGINSNYGLTNTLMQWLCG